MVKFINLNLETDAKLKKFREFYKKQIITAHTLEFTVSDRNLKKNIIHQTLEFCNVLVRYYGY